MTLKANKQISAKLYDNRANEDLEKETKVMSWYKQELATTTNSHSNDNRNRGRDSKPELPGL
jgi:hypothetical protein